MASSGLNGAQIQAAQGIVQSVADGQLPLEAGRQLLLIAFPFLNDRSVDALINALRHFKPTPQAQSSPSPNRGVPTA